MKKMDAEIRREGRKLTFSVPVVELLGCWILGCFPSSFEFLLRWLVDREVVLVAD